MFSVLGTATSKKACSTCHGGGLLVIYCNELSLSIIHQPPTTNPSFNPKMYSLLLTFCTFSNIINLGDMNIHVDSHSSLYSSNLWTVFISGNLLMFLHIPRGILLSWLSQTLSLSAISRCMICVCLTTRPFLWSCHLYLCILSPSAKLLNPYQSSEYSHTCWTEQPPLPTPWFTKDLWEMKTVGCYFFKTKIVAIPSAPSVHPTQPDPFTCASFMIS